MTEQGHFAVCIRNAGYEASLELRKLYEVVPDLDAERDGMLRVIDESDRRQAEHRSQRLANSYANGVGLFLFEPVGSDTAEALTSYRNVEPPAGLDVDSAVMRVCRQIRAR